MYDQLIAEIEKLVTFARLSRATEIDLAACGPDRALQRKLDTTLNDLDKQWGVVRRMARVLCADVGAAAAGAELQRKVDNFIREVREVRG